MLNGGRLLFAGMCSLLFGVGILGGVAVADSYGGAFPGPQYWDEFVGGGERCWFVNDHLRHPALNSANKFDANSWNFARISSDHNCGPNSAGYSRPPTYLGVQTYVYKSTGSPTGICIRGGFSSNTVDAGHYGAGYPVNSGNWCNSGNYYLESYAIMKWNTLTEVGIAYSPPHYFG